MTDNRVRMGFEKRALESLGDPSKLGVTDPKVYKRLYMEGCTEAHFIKEDGATKFVCIF